MFQGELPPPPTGQTGPENADLVKRFLQKLRSNCPKDRPEEWEVRTVQTVVFVFIKNYVPRKNGAKLHPSLPGVHIKF